MYLANIICSPKQRCDARLLGKGMSHPVTTNAKCLVSRCVTEPKAEKLRTGSNPRLLRETQPLQPTPTGAITYGKYIFTPLFPTFPAVSILDSLLDR